LKKISPSHGLFLINLSTGETEILIVAFGCFKKAPKTFIENRPYMCDESAAFQWSDESTYLDCTQFFIAGGSIVTEIIRSMKLMNRSIK
jgi:hypothetical protein